MTLDILSMDSGVEPFLCHGIMTCVREINEEWISAYYWFYPTKIILQSNQLLIDMLDIGKNHHISWLRYNMA